MYKKSKKYLKNKIPFFSILIPSYNRPNYIVKCLDSILESNFQDFEIIISDDNSPSKKEIEKIIKPYLTKGEITFYSQEINLKEPGNKNFLINKAKGEYNIFLGDDDILLPNSLSILRNYIVRNPEFSIYLFGYTLIDDLDRTIYSRRCPKELKIEKNNKSLIQEFLKFDIFPFWFFHPASFCCKGGLEKSIKYSENVGIGEDYMFLIELIKKKTNMFVIPESLFNWRKIFNNKKIIQQNQSMGFLNDVIARKKILTQIIKTKNFDPPYYKFINSYEFRKVFLYRQMSLLQIKNNSEELNLDNNLWAEYLFFLKNTNFFEINIKPYLQRVVKYIYIFGIKGFIFIIKILFQKFIYNLFIR